MLRATLSVAYALRILAKTVVHHHQREEEESEQDERNEDPVPLQTRYAAGDFHLIIRDHTLPEKEVDLIMLEVEHPPHAVPVKLVHDLRGIRSNHMEEGLISINQTRLGETGITDGTRMRRTWSSKSSSL